MDTELMLDVGQANELKLAFRRAGYTNADIKKMCESDTLAQLLPVLKGHANVVTIKHTIDCDVDPYLPNDWKVEEHIKGGQFVWDPTKVALYLSDSQKDIKVIQGDSLRKELKGKPVLNANVLDYLLAHPNLIPEEWKYKYIFFWGTIYRDSDSYLCVRCLSWDDGGWHWLYDWLGIDFSSRNPCTALASS